MLPGMWEADPEFLEQSGLDEVKMFINDERECMLSIYKNGELHYFANLDLKIRLATPATYGIQGLAKFVANGDDVLPDEDYGNFRFTYQSKYNLLTCTHDGKTFLVMVKNPISSRIIMTVGDGESN